MASHRTAIREKVKEILTGKTIAGSAIFTSRAKPLGEEDMPCLLIYTGADKRGRLTEEHDMSLVYRQVELVVECAIANARDLDLEAVMEQAADNIETAIAADETLGNLVIECYWQSTDIDIVADGRKLVGAVRVEFSAELYSRHDADMSWWTEDGPTETPSQPPTIIEPAEPDSLPRDYIVKPVKPDHPAPEYEDDKPWLTDPDGNPIDPDQNNDSPALHVDGSYFMHGVQGTTKK